jgi:hypothetical protein
VSHEDLPRYRFPPPDLELLRLLRNFE